MKVLLYSHFFYPSVGGVESVSLTLANGFLSNNIDCIVVTTSNIEEGHTIPLTIFRNPNRSKQIELVKWADIILFNGASLALQPWPLLFRKPFIWIHTGYQVSCVDGCGWVEGNRAPLEPVASVLYHLKYSGLRQGVSGAFKLLIRRFYAKYLVTKHVAITKWMLNIQKLPRQVQIYNPFPINGFFKLSNTTSEYDFIYLGRIVSEKGISTLLHAFSKVAKSINTRPKLLIIGDGNWKSKMEKLADELHIEDSVSFVGKKTGKDLLDFVAKGEVAIVPSEWYEPMGGVALELMAARKSLIVSEFGGLKECVGEAGLYFTNGDSEDLARCMVTLLTDTSVRDTQLRIGRERIKKFLPSIFIEQYIELLQTEVVKKV